MLVGLTGESRSGKDSVAQVLVEKYGFRQLAMAQAIRDLLLCLNPWLRDNEGDLVQLRWLYEECDGDWDRIKAASDDSVEFMIRLGQGARDIISTDVWINTILPDGYDSLRDGNICISDIRQPNECDFLYRWGGELWQITRPGTARRGMDGLLKDVRPDAHIVNDGTLEDLANSVSWIVEGI